MFKTAAIKKAALLSLALAAAGCVTPPMKQVDRDHVYHHYFERDRQLAHSMVVSPFFRDASRRLLLEQPPEEAVMLVTPRGQPIVPGKAQEVLPAGTRVHVAEVAFPTAWNAIYRIMTPAERTWVEMTVRNRSGRVRYVLALRPDLDTEAKYRAEIDRMLTETDVDAEVAQLPDLDRDAVRTREIVPGVSKRALELALGATRYVSPVPGEAGVEEWTWRSDAGVHRKVVLRDGVVEKVLTPYKPAPRPADAPAATPAVAAAAAPAVTAAPAPAASAAPTTPPAP